MDSHHEERISELLDKIRADECSNGGTDAGLSHQGGWCNTPQERSHDRDENDTTDSGALTHRVRYDSCQGEAMNQDAGPSSCYRDWYETPEVGLYKKRIRGATGPSTDSSWYDTPLSNEVTSGKVVLYCYYKSDVFKVTETK